MMNENVELLQNETAEEYLQNVTLNVTQFIEENLGEGHFNKSNLSNSLNIVV